MWGWPFVMHFCGLHDILALVIRVGSEVLWLKRLVSLLAVMLVMAACSAQAEPAEVIVSAAASMAGVLQEAQPGFEAQHAGVKLRFNFGSSGALAQQIEQGAPADLFIAAATGPMDSLVQKGLVAAGAVQVAATNQLVLIRAKTGEAVVTDWRDLAGDRVRRIAVGNPQHVPAGQYARATLAKLNLLAAAEPRFVLGEDVRQVLGYVESGEVQAGIVYRTDAATSQKVVVVSEAPAGSHAPVVYPMAVLRESRNGAQAGAFAEYLLSAAGREILAKHGFGAGN